MKKKLLIVLLVFLFVFSFATELSFSQVKVIDNTNTNSEQIKPDYLKISQITGWDLDTSQYFISEARLRGVLVWKEALPIVHVETGGTYKFDLINNNTNGTTDVGLFQINDITYPFIVAKLAAEGKEFESGDRLNPKFNISAGIFWLSYLKSEYGLKSDKLFTSYNKGVTGAKNYASRSGTYETRYSREVKKAKEKFKEYKNKGVDN